MSSAGSQGLPCPVQLRPVNLLNATQLQVQRPRARVVAVGPHARAVQKDDRVLFEPDDKSEVEVHGELYVVMRERDVHAVDASDLLVAARSARKQ